MKLLRSFPVIAVALFAWACTATDQAAQTQEPVLQLLTGSNTYEAAAEPSEITDLSFLTGGAWNAAISYIGEKGWITLDASSGKDAGIHKLQARLSRNVSGKARSAILSIQSGKAARIKVSVSQKSLPRIATESLTITSPKLGTGMANPLVDYLFCADPTAVEYQGRLYVYGTNDHQQYLNAAENTYEHIQSLVMLSTGDLVNWTYHGTIPVHEIAPWIKASWAPSVVYTEKADGSPLFSLYFSNSGWGLGVLEASSPLGPWTSPLGTSLIDGNNESVKGKVTIFDPGAVVDENGTGWIAFGGTQGWIAQLGADMHSLATEPVALPSPFHFEANELNYIGHTYVYTYNNNWAEHTPWTWGGTAPTSCSMVCFKSTEPLNADAWTYGGMYFKNPGHNGMGYGNNHTHLHKFQGQWYLLYHSGFLQSAYGTEGGFRCLQMDSIEVDEEKVVVSECIPSRQGVEALGNLDAFASHPASLTAATQNIVFNATETLGHMNVAVGSPSLKAGTPQAGIIEVRGVDFGGGASQLVCRLKGTGHLSVRLDHFNGADIALQKADGSAWSEVTEPCFETLTGIHTLYFVLEKGVEMDTWQFQQ